MAPSFVSADGIVWPTLRELVSAISELRQPEGNQTSQYKRVCRYPSSLHHSNIRIAVHADGKLRETSCANNFLLEGHDTSNHAAPETIAAFFNNSRRFTLMMWLLN